MCCSLAQALQVLLIYPIEQPLQSAARAGGGERTARATWLSGVTLWPNTYRRLKKDAHATFSKSSIDTLPPTQASFTAIVAYA